ncbi:MAG: hypothetical protein ACXABY_27045 [Candidatus Thorarchaeota archaeon]|jgi:hypothetical protein
MPVDAIAETNAANADAAAGAATRRTVSDQETVRMDQLSDVGQDEAANLKMQEQHSIWVDMDARRATNGLDHDQQVRQLAIQSLQNAVETANMVGKQAVRHGDIAINGHWNIDDRDAFLASILKNTFNEAK